MRSPFLSPCVVAEGRLTPLQGALKGIDDDATRKGEGGRGKTFRILHAQGIFEPLLRIMYCEGRFTRALHKKGKRGGEQVAFGWLGLKCRDEYMTYEGTTIFITYELWGADVKLDVMFEAQLRNERNFAHSDVRYVQQAIRKANKAL